jgi:hypothetical protein
MILFCYFGMVLQLWEQEQEIQVLLLLCCFYKYLVNIKYQEWVRKRVYCVL